MLTHEFQKRVRYGETDQMGFLYYGNYAQYYEIGRVEFLRSLGLTYKSLERDYGVMMPVKNMEVRYLRPAEYDDLLTIRTILKDISDKDIFFYVEILNEAGKIVNGAKVRLMFIDAKTKKSIPTPEILTEKLTSQREILKKAQ